MNYRAVMRKKLLEELYNKLSDEDKRLYVQMSMQDKSHSEIMQSLQAQEKRLSEIERKQSWWLDLSSNVAGNAIYDAALWITSKVFGKL